MIPFTPLSEARVAIVGLGLIGGSLAAALSSRQVGKEVIGIARRPDTLVEAMQRGWIHTGSTDLAQGVADADFVILATPPRVILEHLRVIGPYLPAGCIVMDVGSTKKAIVHAMNELPENIYPLGGHPMCGKEQTGLSAADAGLFQGRPFVLTPLPRTSPEVIEQARALVEAIGARPIILDAATHDRMVAWTSHLPHVVAIALVRSAMAGAQQDPGLWSLVSSGFRDTTRLAASDLTMMVDIFYTNREAILAAAEQFEKELAELCELLRANDEPALREHLWEAIRRRREIGGT